MRAAMLLVGAAFLTLGAAPAPRPRELCAKPARTANSYCTIVFFDFDSTEVPASAWPILDTVVGEVADNEGAKVVLAGYTDTGTPDYAIGLSQRMAASVQSHLVQQGIDPKAITTEAYGINFPRVPAAKGKREPGNRRVEIWVIY